MCISSSKIDKCIVVSWTVSFTIAKETRHCSLHKFASCLQLSIFKQSGWYFPCWHSVLRFLFGCFVLKIEEQSPGKKKPKHTTSSSHIKISGTFSFGDFPIGDFWLPGSSFCPEREGIGAMTQMVKNPLCLPYVCLRQYKWAKYFIQTQVKGTEAQDKADKWWISSLSWKILVWAKTGKNRNENIIILLHPKPMQGFKVLMLTGPKTHQKNYQLPGPIKWSHIFRLVMRQILDFTCNALKSITWNCWFQTLLFGNTPGIQILTAFVLPKKRVTESGHVLETTKLMNFTL